MADLLWKKHDAEIVSFIRRITIFYLKTEADDGNVLTPEQGILLRNNYATPKLIQILLDYLSRVTLQVEISLARTKAECIALHIGVPILEILEDCGTGSTTYGAIINDFDNWKERLARYEELTAEANQRNPDASGDEDREFWDNVTKPLLLGFYPGVEQQSRLDAVTPLTIAWQIEVAKAAYSDARERFWKDLREQAEYVAEQLTEFGGGAILIAIGAVALGYGLSR